MEGSQGIDVTAQQLRPREGEPFMVPTESANARTPRTFAKGQRVCFINRVKSYHTVILEVEEIDGETLYTIRSDTGQERQVEDKRLFPLPE